MQQQDPVREKAWVLAVSSDSSGLGITGLDELNGSLERGYRVVRFERLSEGGDGQPALAFIVAAKRLRRKGK